MTTAILAALTWTQVVAALPAPGEPEGDGERRCGLCGHWGADVRPKSGPGSALIGYCGNTTACVARQELAAKSMFWTDALDRETVEAWSRELALWQDARRAAGKRAV